MNEKTQKADYCLEINFKKGSESPSIVFRSKPYLGYDPNSYQIK